MSASGARQAASPIDLADVSLVVVVTEPEPLARCLEAVRAGTLTPREIIVAADARLDRMGTERARATGARVVSLTGVRSTEEVRGAGVAESGGAVLALTESHCRPGASWLAELVAGFGVEIGAVGGTVEHDAARASLADWAFHFCDYAAFLAPQADRDAESLTDCNVAYDRRALSDVEVDWRASFHVWTINAALRARGHGLRLKGRATVWQHRSVSPAAAARESFAHGRLFAERRLATPSRSRLLYALGSPLIFPLLLGRLVRRGLRHRRLAVWFVASLPWSVVYTAAWSGGEALGYVLAREPVAATVAH